MPEKMIKEMIKTPGRYTVLVDKNFKVQVFDMHTTYTIEVDNNFDTQGVTNPNYQDPFKKAQGHGLDPALHHPQGPKDMVGLPSGLKPGCVGLAMLVPGKKDDCIWKFDSWW